MLALALAAEVLFSFTDPRIHESSGLAVSSTGSLVYTHNDSGDAARFFAVDPATGETVTTYLLPGVQTRDWEDMARGPDEQGRSSLWLADIGDNSAARDHGILVHRVAEPAASDRREVTTEPPTSFRLRYPDGPGDAEAFLVHPQTGRVYVVSKPLAGPARVYEGPAELDPAAPNLLTQIGEVDTRATGTPGGPGIGSLAQLLVTAGDFSADGTTLGLRTYTDLYEWTVRDGDVAAALRTAPAVTPLPGTEQGEGLAYAPDGGVLVSTEGVSAPVHRLTPRAVAAAEPERTDGPSWPLVAAGGALLAALLVVRGAVRRRRYARR